MLVPTKGPRNGSRYRLRLQAKECVCRCITRFLLAMVSFVVFALPACCQDSGSEENEFHGNGAEITVTVRDSSGVQSSAAMVKLYRDGTIPSRQGETSRGSAVLVVNDLGAFTVMCRRQIRGRAKGSVDPCNRENAGGSLPATIFGCRKYGGSSWESGARAESKGSAR